MNLIRFAMLVPFAVSTQGWVAIVLVLLILAFAFGVMVGRKNAAAISADLQRLQTTIDSAHARLASIESKIGLGPKNQSTTPAPGPVSGP